MLLGERVFNMQYAGERRLWDELRGLKREFAVSEWCVARDFNVVISRAERRGISSTFNQTQSREFEKFIEDMRLIDLPMLGVTPHLLL